MTINRDNYETFFLLYVDNELSATEKTAVEAFAAQHADLQEELLQLRNTVLPADELMFTDKLDLFKSTLTAGPIEEKLLLHLDNELPQPQIKKLEQVIAENASVLSDWEALRLTKLDGSEKIVFPDKPSLYRKEKDNVVAGRFIRWAIAAALLGAGFFIGITFTNKKADQPRESVAKKDNQVNSQQPVNNVKETKSGNEAAIASTNDVKAIPIAVTLDASQQTNRATDNADAIKDRLQSTVASITQQEQNSNELNRNNNEKQLAQNDHKVLTIKNYQPAERISPEKTDAEMVLNVPKKRPDLTDINVFENGKNSFASVTNLNDKNPDETHILYMNEEDVSRSKVGGLFRRIKRTVERTANIKTGNSLKIAGFEIALK